MTPLTPHQARYCAHVLTHRAAGGSVESLAATLVDAQVDLNPHQVDAALFACQNPLSRGVILADEVGLGKTIEAGLVILQRWTERKRAILIIVPANLRKQWHQEMQEKFGLQAVILEAKSYNALKKKRQNPFCQDSLIICSYPFAKAKANDIKRINWDLVVIDEAHRLRNVYKKGNVIAKTLKDALQHVPSKMLLTATPLQNSLLELYGLVSVIDERVFGSLESFRDQYNGKAGKNTLEHLRGRLAPVCRRTLRRQVTPYVPYTKRRAMVQEFTPSEQEQEFSAMVAEYLRRPDLQALPAGQRHLISLVLWKLLASSSRAIAGAFDTMTRRLQNTLEQSPAPDLLEEFDKDYEALGETAEEWDADEGGEILTAEEYRAVADEIEELKKFKELAQAIREDEKSRALLTALDRAFAELEKLGAPRKAIIFTESRRTQDYLLQSLAQTPYAGDNGAGIVLFNGTNSDAQAQKIYRDWRKRHAGSDKITGSPTADTRAALVEYFKENATIMIATEAGAEGINLQFCSLVINYDLPWNPQRVEQRIGRSHRYGQKHDVVVVNFVDKSNPADQRVYELLDEKFQLFSGLFGASDEVLGAIGSGVDIERRIADIYRHCRTAEDIQAAFDSIQSELSAEIQAGIMKTRKTLLENFDEEVHARLRLREEESRTALNKYERLLLDLTQSELGSAAEFDESGFTLKTLPEHLSGSLNGEIPLGRYELPRQSGNARLYRINHPLAQAVIEHAKNRDCPPACLQFDYRAHGSRISTLEPYRGQRGQLAAKIINISTQKYREQHLLIAAVSQNGSVLQENDPEKLLRLPAQIVQSKASLDILPDDIFGDQLGIAIAAKKPFKILPELENDLARRRAQILQAAELRKTEVLNQEDQRLDDWVEDLKNGLEKDIKNTEQEIKEVKRTIRSLVSMEEKAVWIKKKSELEKKYSRQKREFFSDYGKIEQQRDALNAEIDAQLAQNISEETLFLIEWEMV